MTSRLFSTIAADAMVLMSAAVGAAALRVFEAEPPLTIVTTDFTLAEAKDKLPILIEHHDVDPEEAFELLETHPVKVFAEPEYASYLGSSPPTAILTQCRPPGRDSWGAGGV